MLEQQIKKASVLTVLLLDCAATVGAQESDQNFKKELNQEAPEQAKKEAEKPDTKASAGDLAKAVQNHVASLVKVPGAQEIYVAVW
jgi:hypothetical protein